MDSNRILGAVLGHAAGDALGVPVEFQPREARTADPVRGMRGYGAHGQPPGTWSDDTSLMLSLLEGLKTGVDYRRQAELFVAWRDEARWTPHGEVFDIGGTTNQAISRLRRGVDPLAAGPAGERDNGNGALMRILPLAFLDDLSDARLADTAMNASRLTHGHPRSQAACVLFVLLARRLLEGAPPAEAYRASLETAGALFGGSPFVGEKPAFDRYLSGGLAGLDAADIRSSGYVVHTLEAAVWCLLTETGFAAAVLKAVNLGDDTDTTGAVAGGLAGAAYGASSIPGKWLDALARRDDIEKLVEEFLNSR